MGEREMEEEGKMESEEDSIGRERGRSRVKE